MEEKLIICVPGPWRDRNDFLRRIIADAPNGRFMFAGMILADTAEKDPITTEFAPADPALAKAFQIAGQGRLAPDLLAAIAQHESIVYLHFPLDLPGQRARLAKFTGLLQRIGGLGVKIEASGIAHNWDRWFALLDGSSFDLYSLAVVLIGGKTHFYSCGMHLFGQPDCAVPRSSDVQAAAELMNRFNAWQIDEEPILASGHSFSVSAEAPRYRLTLEADTRHEPDDLFFNPGGIWALEPIRS